jgi:copper ion binding protein
MERTFEIEGMSCQHCVRAVTNALKEVPGVRDVQVEVGRAVVFSDAPVSADAIANALAQEGYRLRL